MRSLQLPAAVLGHSSERSLLGFPSATAPTAAAAAAGSVVAPSSPGLAAAAAAAAAQDDPEDDGAESSLFSSPIIVPSASPSKLALAAQANSLTLLELGPNAFEVKK